MVLQFLEKVRAWTNSTVLCAGGDLFFHSYLNTLIKQHRVFASVFIPVDPGNAGLSVGVAVKASGLGPTRLSPFLGPSYEPDYIKWTLENCKLSYSWRDDGDVLELAIQHLQQGRLVGWFEGRMEWGPRALGARSILANPFSPYVLENLNRFLKRREPWRGYALSALPSDVVRHFSGPDEAAFMECDYAPNEPGRFKAVMPSPDAAIRIHSVDMGCPPRFRSLIQAFGDRTGMACLVNTSFNGFHEPIVCTPRDAVRVFFGSGLDMLILDNFVLTK